MAKPNTLFDTKITKEDKYMSLDDKTSKDNFDTEHSLKFIKKIKNYFCTNVKNDKKISSRWIELVFFAFLPSILVILANFFKYSFVDFNKIFGKGELISSTFLIVTPYILHCNKECKDDNNNYVFYLLLFSSFSQLIAYIMFNTNNTNNNFTVTICSIISVISSLFITYICDIQLQSKGVDQNV